jgi:hypothetical protein
VILKSNLAMALSKQLQRIHEAIMTIKQYGGVFGRNPTFNDVTIEGQLTFDGDIDINSDLKVSGDIETTGNVIIATSGKGIDFSATAGTGTSELLDDYEEGTWTPSVIAGAISGTSITYTGNYTKIGNTVTVWFRAENTAGDIQVSSYAVLGTLPFTAASEGTGTVTTEDIDQFSRQGFANVSGTILALSACGSATGTVNLSCSVTYKV